MSGLNAGGSYRPLIVEMALSTPNFLMCSIWAVNTVIAEERLTLVNQDISALNLGRRFGFVFVPFRSFQAVLTIDLQRKSVEAIRRHLEPTGRLALHLFDPRLDLLIDANVTLPGLSGTHPETGRRYVGEVLRTKFDHLSQIRRDLWRYAEIGPNGEVLAEDTREMALRWTCRWELHHLNGPRQSDAGADARPTCARCYCEPFARRSI